MITAKKHSTDFFERRLSTEDRKKYVAKYGEIPRGDYFEVTIERIKRWGNPLWQVYEEIYERNAKVSSLTEDDDIWIWKVLHVPLLRAVMDRFPPSYYKDSSATRQWRQEYLQEASGWLWELIRSGRGKRISVTNIIYFAIGRVHVKSLEKALNRCSVEATDAVNDMASSKAANYRSVPDQVANKIDWEETGKTIDDIVVNMLAKRFPESMFPGMRDILKLAMRGNHTIAKEYKWVIDYITVYRRIALHEKDRQKPTTR